MPKDKSQTIEKIINAEILKSGESCYAIAKNLGISQGVLSRLLHGQRGQSIYMAEQLLDYSGSKIVKDKGDKQ
jgi:predicted transcriptional regulator